MAASKLGDTLEEFLAQVVPDLKLRRLMLKMASARAGRDGYALQLVCVGEGLAPVRILPAS